MKTLHAALAVVAGLLSVAAAARDWRAPRSAVVAMDAARDYIAAPDLAERILRGQGGLFVFDLRPEEEFEQMHIPTSQAATLESLAAEALPAGATIVLYATDERRAIDAWAMLRRRGYRQVFLLRQGLYEWISRVIEPRLSTDATPEERAQFLRAAALSRFFGGVPRSDVDRADVPVGYWNGDGTGAGLTEATRNAVASVRRRGC